MWNLLLFFFLNMLWIFTWESVIFFLNNWCVKTFNLYRRMWNKNCYALSWENLSRLNRDILYPFNPLRGNVRLYDYNKECKLSLITERTTNSVRKCPDRWIELGTLGITHQHSTIWAIHLIPWVTGSILGMEIFSLFWSYAV